MTGDACRRKHEAQRHRSGEHGGKAGEHGKDEQSSEGCCIHNGMNHPGGRTLAG